jgi:hypothetical protein
VDETDDMRGGLELQGVMNLAAFVKAGGAFVAITSSASLPLHFGLVQGLRIKSTPTLWARGGVFRSRRTDENSPIAYGYDDELGVYFNTAPVFATVTGGRGRFGGFGRGGGAPAGPRPPGSTLARRTGRGTAEDTDVVQGRARDLGAAGVDEFNESHADDDSDGPGGGAPSNENRIVFRFAAVEKLLISGGLNNGGEMADAPAVVDAKHGDGHVVLFSFNPFWRGETVGAYALVFNTLLHFNNLDAGTQIEEQVTTDPDPGPQ